MPQIHYNRDGNWTTCRFDSDAEILLNANVADPRVVASGDSANNHVAWHAKICSLDVAGTPSDILLLRNGAQVRINGHEVAAGLAVLENRSLLSVGARHFYYSSESPAEIEIFQPGDHPIFCARCNDELSGGQAVRCPGCRTWYHQAQQRPCFTYSEQCPICNAPTAIGETNWDPTLL